MNREEAIKKINAIKELELIAEVTVWNDRREAVEMAIEALQAEPVVHLTKANLMAIEALEQEPVVRCRDCKHYSVEGETTRFGWCGYWNKPTDEMRYCSDGERREK